MDQGVYGLFNGNGVDQRLVALDVDDDVGSNVEFSQSLDDPVSPAQMVASCHDGRVPASRDRFRDPFVVGGDVNAGKIPDFRRRGADVGYYRQAPQ